ncbi:hypothetical protein L1049_027803 [Liquidambar formosana]|uniref:Pentatricopeptide repeat-containing protein n=1 Tax=Liquidambar formosana TaxID=63359 RepID=A0AAP0RHV0_LIQFO
MNHSIQIQKLTLLLHNKTTVLSTQNLLQIHAQLITAGLHSDHTWLLPLFQLCSSNPSTLHHATSIFTHAQQPNTPTLHTMILRHASEANPLHAISSFKAMQRMKPNTPLDDPFIYASLIKACNKLSAIREGKSIHCHILRLGFDCNVNVLNTLVHFYSNSASLIGYACCLFDRIPERTIVTVNCMVSGYVKNKLFDMGLDLFNGVLSGCYGLSLKPNHVTLVILISGCAEFGGFSVGELLHSYCCKVGLSLRNEVCNALMDLYAKLGRMGDAARVFHEMPERDLVSWNTMIAGYAKNNNCGKALTLFKEMRIGNVGYDRVSLIGLISACANTRDLDTGKMVHGYIKASGTEATVPVGTALINMYSKCGLIDFARRVFDELPAENIASWNSMIHGYVECGHFCEALRLFNLIKCRKLIPDEVTMLGLISACRNSEELYHGVHIHSYIESSDHLNGNIFLSNALIDMYAKCGCMTQAKAVFDKMPEKDVVSWTSIIVGHAINGEGKEALVAFQQMNAEKIEPNSVTFIGVLLACDHAGLIEDGRNLYDTMCKVYDIEPRIEHCGCIVDMHARAGMLEEAQEFVKNMPVEPNAVVWRMLINACRVHGNFTMGLSLASGLKELSTLRGPEDHVISSNFFAEAGRWSDVLRARSSMVVQKAPKVAGKSSILDATT